MAPPMGISREVTLPISAAAAVRAVSCLASRTYRQPVLACPFGDRSRDSS
jgi:hypothetical protein